MFKLFLFVCFFFLYARDILTTFFNYNLLIKITARIFMMNCTLSTFGFILFVMAFISYYQHCSLSSSLQRIQFLQIWCRFPPRSIESSYLREHKKKKKKNGRLEFNAYSATLCFRWRRRRQIKLSLLLI